MKFFVGKNNLTPSTEFFKIWSIGTSTTTCAINWSVNVPFENSSQQFVQEQTNNFTASTVSSKSEDLESKSTPATAERTKIGSKHPYETRPRDSSSLSNGKSAKKFEIVPTAFVSCVQDVNSSVEASIVLSSQSCV